MEKKWSNLGLVVNELQEFSQNGIANRPHLGVVKMDYVGCESLTWQQLFSGFDSLHAITYSSGIGFVYQLLGQFKTVEIIFGCDYVISYSLQGVMAYQC